MSIDINVNDLMTQLTTLVQKYGGQVVDTASQVTQIESVSELVSGVVFGILAIIAGFVCRYAIKKENEESYGSPWIVAIVVSAVFAVIGTLFFLIQICDVWNWIGIFNPKLKLIHDIIEHATSTRS
jgi:hypothetical protein